MVGYATGNGFIYDVNSKTYTAFSYPGASSTYPVNINNAGSIVGAFRSGVDDVGFRCSASDCKQITPDGISVRSVGVTDAGVVYGMLEQPFRLAQGHYRRFKIPGEPKAEIFGVNFAGTALVGWLPDVVSRAFLYQPGSLTILEYPASLNTQAYSVPNDGKTVVGAFVGPEGNSHGFIWTADEAPTK